MPPVSAMFCVRHVAPIVRRLPCGGGRLHPVRAALVAAALVALGGCGDAGAVGARERFTRLGQAVQAGSDRARDELQTLGEVAQAASARTRARLERAGERVMRAREALDGEPRTSADP